jgi:uncharacterized membrane protein YedE/YeeE
MSLPEEIDMRVMMAFVVGLVFGIGLIVAGMTDPAKVQGFLDLAGEWDPSLAFVMGGAILVGMLAFPFRLVVGGLAFGAGWGLAGFCPGPALASLASGRFEVLLFTGAMLTGMGIFEMIERRATAPGSRAA